MFGMKKKPRRPSLMELYAKQQRFARSTDPVRSLAREIYISSCQYRTDDDATAIYPAECFSMAENFIEAENKWLKEQRENKS